MNDHMLMCPSLIITLLIVLTDALSLVLTSADVLFLK